MMCLPAALLVPTMCRGWAGTVLGQFLQMVPIRCTWSCLRVSLPGSWGYLFPGGGRCFRTEVTGDNSAGSPVGVPGVFVRSSRLSLATWYKKEPLICAVTFRDNVCCCLCPSSWVRAHLMTLFYLFYFYKTLSPNKVKFSCMGLRFQRTFFGGTQLNS